MYWREMGEVEHKKRSYFPKKMDLNINAHKNL